MNIGRLEESDHFHVTWEVMARFELISESKSVSAHSKLHAHRASLDVTGASQSNFDNVWVGAKKECDLACMWYNKFRKEKAEGVGRVCIDGIIYVKQLNALISRRSTMVVRCFPTFR